MNDQKIKLNLNHPNKIKKTFSKLIIPVEQLISYEKKYNALMFIQSLENLKAENMFNKVLVKNPESIVMWYFKGYNLFKMYK